MKQFCNLCFCLMLISSVYPNRTATAATHVFQGPAVTIPIKGPSDPSFIYVEGIEGNVVDIQIKLVGLKHSYGEETMIAVTNPDGWATLMWDGADCRFNTVDITLSDASETAVENKCTSGAALPTGSYRPGYEGDDREFSIPIAPMRPMFKTMNELIMPNINGRWILWSEDFVNSDGGTLTSWEVIIETEDPIP